MLTPFSLNFLRIARLMLERKTAVPLSGSATQKYEVKSIPSLPKFVRMV